MKWVKRKVDAPAAWISRALRNPAQHKRTVDVYKYQETETNTTLGDIIFLNALPVANDDGITINRNSSGVVIDVLSNDSDEDVDNVLVIESTTAASNGTVVNNGDVITYTPNSGFVGTDTFTYTLSDGEGGTDTATVTINVLNIGPVATDDVTSVAVGESQIVDVLANDSDPDGDVSELSVIDFTSSNSNLVVTNNGDGTLSIQAMPGSVGVSTIEYTISDADGGTATATVTVTVTDPNTAPVAVDDAFFTTMNRSTTINVLANDTDPDGDDLTLVSVDTEGLIGTVEDINADGTLTYVPPADWCGETSFTYTITDGTQESTATVTITVLD